MVADWASFAHTGAPAPAGLPPWQRDEGRGANVMRFEPGKIGLYDAYTYHRCSFWKALYP